MKRLLICIICLITALSPLPALSDNDVAAKVNAPYFVIVDADDPTHIFYSRQCDDTCYPSSTLKILTCIIAIENCQLDELVTVSNAAASLPETHSRIGLIKGEQLSVHELLYGLMLDSGNDAAIALAEHISGSIEDFAVLMNQKAQELGMNGSHFVNPHGVHTAEQYTTALDMAKLTAYVMKNETFCQITGTLNYTIAPNSVRKAKIELKNSNWLMGTGADKFYYEYAVGGKTGSSASQGKCFVSIARRDGVTLVCTMFGLTEGGDISQRLRMTFVDAKYLFEQVYQNEYSLVSAADFMPEFASQTEAPANAQSADPLLCRAVYDEGTLLLRNDIIEGIKSGSIQPEYSTAFSQELVAPVSANQQVGTFTSSFNGRTLFMGKLISTSDIAEFVPTSEPTAAPTPLLTAAPTSAPTPPPNVEQKAEDDSGVFTVVLIVATAIIALCIVGLIILGLRMKRTKENR